MTKIAVTGAAGTVGREVLDALQTENHEITALTYKNHSDIDSTVLDITEIEPLSDALKGHDIAIHLAGDSSAFASWDSVLSNNIQGT